MSLSAILQLVFIENYFTHRCIFDVFIGGSEFRVLFCHVDLLPSTLTLDSHIIHLISISLEYLFNFFFVYSNFLDLLLYYIDFQPSLSSFIF